jgi:MoxR-like ATPase
LRNEVGRFIVGQEDLVSRLLIGLISNGHILVEGVPGLAKTMAIRVLAGAIGVDFARVQFTPDLLPADLIGTRIYDPRDHSFSTSRGPIFANLVLADEINRAPAKVQSGLLEAMQEKQVTIGGEQLILPEPFLVMATQNPLELEGTYPLPEAQIDRFMLKVNVDYPNRACEAEILSRMAHPNVDIQVEAVATAEEIMHSRELVDRIYIDPKVVDYILDIIFATRLDGANLSKRQSVEALSDLLPLIEVGASPRATLYLTLAAKAMAFLDSRAYVTPEDIKAITPDVLRHRIVPSYEAEAEGLGASELIDKLLSVLVVP